jgi:tetratricopeptide (TPR) repeat protein
MGSSGNGLDGLHERGKDGMRENIPLVIRLIGPVFFLAILPAQAYALTPDQIFDKVKDSIVVVKTLDAQGRLKGQGSGVLLPSGKIATNCSVVEGGDSFRVGRGKELVRAALYVEDGEKDICLLDAKGVTGEPAQLGKSAGLKVGDAVYVVGAPQGLELSLSGGIIAQLRGGPPPLIQTTAAISPGSSGGGLFDEEGRLVGLTALYLEGRQSLNFAMPVEWIGDARPGRKKAARGRSQTEWLKRSIALEQMKDWQGMLDWCRKWTKREPENANAWSCLGVAYNEGYHQTIRIDPEYVFTWFSLGLTYFTLKRYNDAIDAYRQALHINPEFADAWFSLGVAYDGLNRYNDAIDAYRQALHINPEFADAWFSLGVAYDGLNRYNDAIDAYRQALHINPEDAGCWYNLGVAYSDLKRYNDAIESLRQALHINPEFADAWNNLGIAYFLSGNRTAALDAVRELRHLDPKKADELFNLIVSR